MNLDWLKKLWDWLNRISPETRSLIIIILFGYVLYTQITDSTKKFITDYLKKEILHNKEAEQYSIKTSVDINRYVQLIADRDNESNNVLLLNYHNSTQSLHGYRYLYLSCLAEVSKSLDDPLLKHQWDKIDFIYYADELTRIHNQSYIQISNIENMIQNFPKLYRLVKSSNAKSVSFFTIEGKDHPIGMIIIFYKNPQKYKTDYYKAILPNIQKLALLLDYERNKND